MLPTALTIAGLDPSGGAGIAADLRSFAAAGAWGAAVCACLTVQSTQGLRRVVPIAPGLLLAQAGEVLADARICALKTGALGSTANARVVAQLLEQHPRIPRVVDPVMIPSRAMGSSSRLNPRRLEPMRALAALATLVTPNLDEAGALLGSPVISERDARLAAVALVNRGATAALVKGGHGEGGECADFLAVGRRVVRIRATSTNPTAAPRDRLHVGFAHRGPPRSHGRGAPDPWGRHR